MNNNYGLGLKINVLSLFTAFGLAFTSSAALVADWSFEESGTTVQDNTGTYTGVLNGSVSHTAGKAGQGLLFSGGNVSFGTAPGNFGTNDFTISYWVRTTGSSSISFLEKRPQCNMDLGSPWWCIRGGGGLFGIEVADSHNSFYVSFATTIPVNDGNWHHIAWTRRGTVYKVYVDGQLNNSATGAGVANVTNTTSMNMAIGVCWNPAYTGSVDELRLYNEALTAEQVTSYYQSLGNSVTNVTDCSSTVAALQARISTLTASNAALSTQLAQANGAILGLQSDLAAANQSLLTLQNQYNSWSQWNSDYTNELGLISLSLTNLTTNFAARFRAPIFTLAGDRPSAQVSNVVSGILHMDYGTQYRLFKVYQRQK